jgi:DNA-binding NtrC family response regulator
MPHSVLIVDDERVLRESLAGLLEGEGFEVVQAENGRVAHGIILERPVDAVVTDVRMPELDGVGLLERLRQVAPETPVILMTAYGTVENAVSAMQAGAWDYLLKPVQFEDLLLKIRRAIEFRELSHDRRVMSEQLARGGGFENIVSDSPNMMRLFEQVRKLAGVKSSVLIVGESGTGKELFARAIHYNGVTRNKPFVAVNCGAIPESLIESELFGHRRGSFTGAIRDKVGYFEAADGGTIFLDEISTLPKNLQSSLLRVLEERAVVPVGDTRARPIEVRVIAASNQDLDGMVARGEFRADLLYRLNVVKLEHIRGVTNAAMRALLAHEWRGNVRELENVIERAVIFADGRELLVDDLPFTASETCCETVGEDLKESMRQFERQHIVACLRRHNFDKVETARCLGIGISSLYRKLEELEIPKHGERRPTAEVS